MRAISPEIKELMRPSAATLEPYDPGFSPVEINVSANENNFGMPAHVRKKVVDAISNVAFNRYPSPLATDLTRAIAAWHRVDPESVCVGNGGDELIFNLFVAFGGKGHVLLNCPPTFSVYQLYAELVETEVVDCPRDQVTLKPDMDAFIEASKRADMAILTSPNNPTGDVVALADIERLLKACPGIVLVDEAYGEFAKDAVSAEVLLSSYPNLVVLHTLSKAFAFAGGRVGYVLANPSVVAALAAVRQPYSIDAIAQAAAEVLVEERTSFSPTIAVIVSERERCITALRAYEDLGIVVWPSQANFYCVRVPHAHVIWQRLKEESSILVRDFSSTKGLEDCLRISIGLPEENDRVVSELVRLVKEENDGAPSKRI